MSIININHNQLQPFVDYQYIIQNTCIAIIICECNSRLFYVNDAKYPKCSNCHIDLTNKIIIE